MFINGEKHHLISWLFRDELCRTTHSKMVSDPSLRFVEPLAIKFLVSDHPSFISSL